MLEAAGLVAIEPPVFADAFARRSIVVRHIEGVAAVLLIEVNLMPMLLLFSGSFAFGCVTALTVLALAAAWLDHGF